MILPMLGRLESPTFGLIIIKANTDLFEKENRMNYKIVFIHTIYKIAAKVFNYWEFTLFEKCETCKYLQEREICW